MLLLSSLLSLSPAMTGDGLWLVTSHDQTPVMTVERKRQIEKKKNDTKSIAIGKIMDM